MLPAVPAPLCLNLDAGSMLATIPAREPISSKQAPLPPVMDLPLDAPAKLSFMESIWAGISVSASAPPPPPSHLLLLRSRRFAAPADVVAGIPPRGSKCCSDNGLELLFGHQCSRSVDVA